MQAVVAVADELKLENYHDIERIDDRLAPTMINRDMPTRFPTVDINIYHDIMNDCSKENVLRLWNYLLELLLARRVRLELSMAIQKIFHEQIYVIDWMDELKVCSKTPKQILPVCHAFFTSANCVILDNRI